jgi:TRAP-type C4-dicarboxylate transport system permease small subunit
VLDKFEKFNHRLSNWFQWIAMAGMLVMVLITGIDVVGGKAFLWRIFGAIDMVQLSQIVAIAFACAFTLIVGRHVRVEFIVARLPRRAQGVIDSFVSLIGLGFFMLIIWRLYVLGHTFQNTGESTPTAYIPLYPFAYGIALASIPVCLLFIQELFRSLAKAVKG